MSYSWISIMGMYNHDTSIMDGLNVPDGIDRENVINNILLQCAELEIIYPEFNTLKEAIKIWSDSNQLTWNKLYKTMTVEYNPIWNVDADIKDIEKISGDKTSGRTIGRTGQDKETVNLTDTKSVQGFNSSSWANAEKIDHTGTDTIDRKENITDNVTDKDNSVREYTQRRTGNIGVTTTQQMLEQERAIAQFNMIEYITESFKKRFCILIY